MGPAPVPNRNPRPPPTVAIEPGRGPSRPRSSTRLRRKSSNGWPTMSSITAATRGNPRRSSHNRCRVRAHRAAEDAVQGFVAGQLNEVAAGSVDNVRGRPARCASSCLSADPPLVGRDARKQVAKTVGQVEPAVLDQGERGRQGQVLGDRADVEDGPPRDPDPPRSVRQADAAREDRPPAPRRQHDTREAAAPLGRHDRADTSLEPPPAVEPGVEASHPPRRVAREISAP